MYTVETTPYKGKPCMQIFDPNGQLVVAFGLRKAEAIIHCIDQIEEFIEQNDSGFVRTEKKRRKV